MVGSRAERVRVGGVHVQLGVGKGEEKRKGKRQG